MDEAKRLEIDRRQLVERVCAAQDCTRDELAAAIGVAPSTLWRWSRAVSAGPLEVEEALRGLDAGRLRVRRGRVEGRSS